MFSPFVLTLKDRINCIDYYINMTEGHNVSWGGGACTRPDCYLCFLGLNRQQSIAVLGPTIIAVLGPTIIALPPCWQHANTQQPNWACSEQIQPLLLERKQIYIDKLNCPRPAHKENTHPWKNRRILTIGLCYTIEHLYGMGQWPSEHLPHSKSMHTFVQFSSPPRWEKNK